MSLRWIITGECHCFEGVPTKVCPGRFGSPLRRRRLAEESLGLCLGLGLGDFLGRLMVDMRRVRRRAAFLSPVILFRYLLRYFIFLISTLHSNFPVANFDFNLFSLVSSLY